VALVSQFFCLSDGFCVQIQETSATPVRLEYNNHFERDTAHSDGSKLPLCISNVLKRGSKGFCGGGAKNRVIEPCDDHMGISAVF
jgi:hypothetical protein